MINAAPSLIFALAAAGLSIAACVTYLASAFHHHARPQRSSWFIWSVLSSVSLAAQIHEGATVSLWFSGVKCAATCVIFAAALRFGVGGLHQSNDRKALVAASLGIALWIWTDSAIYALAISITVSLLGGAITVAKAYKTPDSEALATWVLSFCASACAVAAVGTMDPVLLAYPVYLLLLSGGIVTAILLARRRPAPSAQPQETPPQRGDAWAADQHARKKTEDIRLAA